MLLALCVLLHCCDSATYSGRDRQLDVPIPRFEADAVIDGDLSDSVWARAARLTGFSQYSPNDEDRKSTRLNSSHGYISYAVFCLKKKKQPHEPRTRRHPR